MKKGDDNEIARLHKEGKSFREIGRLLGISHVAVRKRYVKAIKVTGNVGYTPEKGSCADQMSAAAENLGFQCNPKGYGNLRKPEILTKANIIEVNDSELPADIPQHYDGNQSGNQRGNGVSVSVGTKDTLAKLSHFTENTKTPAEPKYYRHIPTGRLFHLCRNEEIDEAIRSEFQPYIPPKYLRKTSEPNRGEIFVWTFFLAQRPDMEPHFEELPGEKKPEERQPEIKRAIPFTNTVKESARTKPDLQFPDKTGESEGSQPESHRDVNPKSQGRDCSEMLRSRRKHDYLESDVNPSEMLTNVDIQEVVNLRKPKSIFPTKLDIDTMILDLRSQGKSLSFIGSIFGVSKVAIFKRLKCIAMRKAKAC